MRSVPALENRKDDPSMSMLSSAVQRSTLGLHSLEQYEPLIGAAAIERIAAKADRVRTMRVAHISSTFYGGGVTELLTPPRDRHRHRLALDSGNAGLLWLHQEASQYAA